MPIPRTCTLTFRTSNVDVKYTQHTNATQRTTQRNAGATLPFRLDYVCAAYGLSSFLFATVVQGDASLRLARYGWGFASTWVWGAVGMVATLAAAAARLAIASMPSTWSQLLVQSSTDPNTSSLLQRCISHLPPVSEMLLAAGTHYSLGVTAVLSVAAVTGFISLASIVNRFSSGRHVELCVVLRA